MTRTAPRRQALLRARHPRKRGSVDSPLVSVRHIPLAYSSSPNEDDPGRDALRDAARWRRLAARASSCPPRRRAPAVAARPHPTRGRPLRYREDRLRRLRLAHRRRSSALPAFADEAAAGVGEISPSGVVDITVLGVVGLLAVQGNKKAEAAKAAAQGDEKTMRCAPRVGRAG